LFLDYDGTLAEFAPTPDVIIPDPDVIELLTRLKNHPGIHPAIISGRRLAHIISLVPVAGVLLAGTYGIEMRLPGGELVNRLDYSKVRPVLDSLKPRWKQLIVGRHGYYLEDKGWALAIHARFAEDQEAKSILSQAREIADHQIDRKLFRILGGDKFLEIGPKLANKGVAIEYLLTNFPVNKALLVYVGDDDKDEEAFEVINRHKGVAVLVSETERDTRASLRLSNPVRVREWLRSLL
jgi:trehalose 6-phosphate phosphatase